MDKKGGWWFSIIVFAIIALAIILFYFLGPQMFMQKIYGGMPDLAERFGIEIGKEEEGELDITKLTPGELSKEEERDPESIENARLKLAKEHITKKRFDDAIKLLNDVITKKVTAKGVEEANKLLKEVKIKKAEELERLKFEAIKKEPNTNEKIEKLTSYLDESKPKNIRAEAYFELGKVYGYPEGDLYNRAKAKEYFLKAEELGYDKDKVTIEFSKLNSYRFNYASEKESYLKSSNLEDGFKGLLGEVNTLINQDTEKSLKEAWDILLFKLDTPKYNPLPAELRSQVFEKYTLIDKKKGDFLAALKTYKEAQEEFSNHPEVLTRIKNIIGKHLYVKIDKDYPYTSGHGYRFYNIVGSTSIAVKYIGDRQLEICLYYGNNVYDRDSMGESCIELSDDGIPEYGEGVYVNNRYYPFLEFKVYHATSYELWVKVPYYMEHEDTNGKIEKTVELWGAENKKIFDEFPELKAGFVYGHRKFNFFSRSIRYDCYNGWGLNIDWPYHGTKAFEKSFVSCYSLPSIKMYHQGYNKETKISKIKFVYTP